MADIEDTLKERGGRYGSFADESRLAMRMKEVFRDGAKWDEMDPFMRHALDMLSTKLARILNGDPYYVDSWHDSIGYLRLVEKELGGE